MRAGSPYALALLALVMAMACAPSLAAAQQLPWERVRLLPTGRMPRPLPEEGEPPRIRLPSWHQILCSFPHAHNCMCEGLPAAPPSAVLNLPRVLRKLRACYENQLRGPSPRGRLEIALRVAPNGRTLSVRRTVDQIGEAGGSACIAHHLLALRFTPLPAGAPAIPREVLQRFLFTPADPAPESAPESAPEPAE